MDMMTVLPDVVWRLSLAVILAGVIGLERGRRGYSAGMRTHVLVCLGSTLAMTVSDVLGQDMVLLNPTVPFEPYAYGSGSYHRRPAFWARGTIMHVGTTQRGLTTAAMIWFVATLGIVIGRRPVHHRRHGYRICSLCCHRIRVLGEVPAHHQSIHIGHSDAKRP